MDKWYFLPDQICYECGKNITDEETIKEKVVTSCPICHTSFTE